MRLILAFLLLLSLPLAHAMTLNSPADKTISSTALQSITFTAGANSSSCSLSSGNAHLQSLQNITLGQTYAFSQTFTEANHSWSINCTSETSSTRLLTIDLTAPTLAIEEYPSALNYSKIRFNYTPSDINIESCELYSDSSGTWSLKKSIPAESGIKQNITFSMPDGSYRWGIVCLDIAGNQAAANSTITIDSRAPEISLISPASFITTQSASLSVSTSESATCRYSKTKNQSFESMAPFEITGSALHKNFLSGLTDGIYNYNIWCTDSLSNWATLDVLFEVNTPVTAKIRTDKAPPLKAGTYTVYLETSKTLAGTPTLTYSFDDGQKVVPVFLSGSVNEWQGTFIVEDTAKKMVGGFSFQGTDLRGTSGTTIIQGKHFVVDTLKPSAPESLRAEPESNGIRIKWYSQNDDIASYNIYRSTSSGVSYSDYYDEINNTQYFDVSATSEVTYYYKVAAVDKAGNLGIMSAEAFATSQSVASVSPVISEKKMLPPVLVPKVENELYRVDKLMIDLNEALISISSSEDTEIIELSKKLNAVKRLEESKASLERAKEKLSALKEQFMTEPELLYELGKHELEIKRIEKTTIQSISVGDKTTFEQALSPTDISEAADELITSLGLNPGTKEEYVRGADTTLFTIKGKAVLAKIRYLNLSEEEKTIITKKIETKEDKLEDVIIIEIIPKELADSTRKITFISEQPEILKEDPVVKFGYSIFKEVEISYSVQGNFVSEASRTKSVPLTQIRTLEPSSPTGLTVFSAFPALKGNLFIISGVLIIVILLGYYVIFLEGIPQFKKTARNEKPSKKDVELEMIKGNIDVIKAELSERIYPVLSTIQKEIEKDSEKQTNMVNSENTVQTQQNEKKLDPTDKTYKIMYEMKMLIEEAKTHIDYGKPQKAAVLYPQIMDRYRQLPAENKTEMYPECIKIHKGLTER